MKLEAKTSQNQRVGMQQELNPFCVYMEAQEFYQTAVSLVDVARVDARVF